MQQHAVLIVFKSGAKHAVPFGGAEEACAWCHQMNTEYLRKAPADRAGCIGLTASVGNADGVNMMCVAALDPRDVSALFYVTLEKSDEYGQA